MKRPSLILAIGLILSLQFLVFYFYQNKDLKVDINNKESKIDASSLQPYELLFEYRLKIID